MENFRFELKEDKKYLQYKNYKAFHIKIKDSGEKLKIEELKNIGKNKFKKIEEIKNEMKYKKDENKEKLNLIRKDKEKYIIEKKEKINLKEEENIKLRDKLNSEIRINNLNNISIIKGNNNINKTYLCTSYISEKMKEEKKLISPREESRIKTTKDKNDFFEDKNKSGKY